MVSICMATYNGAKYIKQQLDSILNQLGERDELIISDDGSKDHTIELISSYDDSRIKIFTNDSIKIFKHGRYIANFENTLNHTSGDIIFFADQDDIWLDGKITCMVEALNTCDLVVSDCKIVNQYLQTIYPSYFSHNQSEFHLFQAFERNPYLGCTMAFKRKLLDYALPFPNCINGHDLWIGILAEMYFKVGIIHEPTILYRRHDLNVSNKEDKEALSLLQKATIASEMLMEAVKFSKNIHLSK